MPLERGYAIIPVNTSSDLYTTRDAIASMTARSWGRFINIASAHGLNASPSKLAYGTAKHGMLGLTKTVALEAAEYGVTCNAIGPAYLLTPVVDAHVSGTAKARRITEKQAWRDAMPARHPTGELRALSRRVAGALFVRAGGSADHRRRPVHRRRLDHPVSWANGRGQPFSLRLQGDGAHNACV